MTDVDVVVVGGGLAGLTAALRLDANLSVVVLEAADFPGGRTLSVDTTEAWLNLGAQYVGGRDSPVASLAQEVGLELTRVDEPTLCVRIDGKFFKARTCAGFLLGLPISLRAKVSFAATYLRIQRERRKMFSTDREVRRGARARLDSVPYADLWSGSHPDAQSLVATMIRSLTGGEMDEVSAYIALLNVPDLGGLRSEKTDPREQLYCVGGGTGRIARRIVELLRGEVRLGAQVIAVRSSADGPVEIVYQHAGERSEISASRCVMATPAGTTAEICLDLDENKRRLLAGIPYTPLVLCGVELSEPLPSIVGDVAHIWESGDDSAWDTIFNLGLAVEQQAALRGGLLSLCAMGRSANRLLTKTDDELTEDVRRTLDSIGPGITRTIVSMFVKRWVPGLPISRPGMLSQLPPLQEPSGRLHFAGDYTDYASMQGAVRSGERAAEEVIAAGVDRLESA